MGTFSRGTHISRRQIMASGLALSLIGFGARAQVVRQDSFNWMQVPFGGGGFVDGFLYHPKEKGLLYARTDIGGAYRFDSAKKRWSPLLDHLGPDEHELMGVLAMAVDPNDANRLYLACGEYLHQWAQDGAVMCSQDRGKTWKKTSLGAGVRFGGNSDGRGTGERLAVDPNASNIIFAGTSQNGLFKSTDYGQGFSKIASPAEKISLVLIDQKSSTLGTPSPTLYIGSGTDEGGLYKSNDGGASFKRIDGLPNMVPHRAVFDELGNLYVTFSKGYAPTGGTDGAVYRMEASSGEWRDISPMAPTANIPFGYSGLDIDPNRPGTVVVSTMNRWSIHDDIFVSRDSGRTWKAMGARSRHNPDGYPWLVNYLKGQDLMGHWIADLKIDPFNSDAMIYGTGYGLWMTSDLGHIDGTEDVHFDFVQKGFEETAVLDMASPSAGPILYAAMGDVSGAAYDDLSQSPTLLFAPSNETNRGIDFAELAPNMVVRTADQAATGGYISDDGGQSWTPFASTPYKKQNAKGEWCGSGKIHISAGGNFLLWVPEKQGVFYSKDHGKTWTLSQGVSTNYDLTLPAVSDRAVEGVFYVYDRSKSQVLISIDGGANFAPIFKDLPVVEGWQSASIKAAPFTARDLWICHPTGLLHAPDANSKMKAIKGVDSASLVTFGKSKDEKAAYAVYLYGKIKGVMGLYISDDMGASWTRIDSDERRFGRIGVIAADPITYGTVYIAPHGRGVFAGQIKQG